MLAVNFFHKQKVAVQYATLVGHSVKELMNGITDSKINKGKQ